LPATPLFTSGIQRGVKTLACPVLDTSSAIKDLREQRLPDRRLAALEQWDQRAPQPQLGDRAATGFH